MTADEMIQKSKLPKELSEVKQWICYKTEKVGKEIINIPVNPVTGQELAVIGSSDYMRFEEALDFKENSIFNVNVGFLLNEADPYIAIELTNALNGDRTMSEIASNTLKMIKGFCYGEITSETSLTLIIKGSLGENRHFRNIKVHYFDRDHIVPINGDAFQIANPVWESYDRLSKLLQYHYKMYCQVDENSEELPPHYSSTKSNQLRLFPNILATTLLEQNKWIKCKSNIYAKSEKNVYLKMEPDEIEREIYDYLSPKYATNKDIEDTKKLILKRLPRDNSLTDASRTKGLINFKNGFYNYESGTYKPYPDNYQTTYQINAVYDKGAQCPAFSKYINFALPKEDVVTAQEVIGYLLSTEMKAQKAFILYGPGNTGKSVLIELIERIIGYDYVSNVPFQDLSTKFSTVRLFGKLLNSYSDLPQGKIKDTGAFKALVSGDTMHGEDKFEKGFDFKNTARLLFATNKLPSNFIDQTTGFYRRLTIIPFQNVVQDKDVDRDLINKLLEERDGIVQWALVGLRRLIQNNYQFTESPTAKALLDEYKKENNNVLWYVDEYCAIDPSYQIEGKTLYMDYEKTCLDARLNPISQREFYNQLEVQFSKDGVTKFIGSQTRAVEFSGIKVAKISND